MFSVTRILSRRSILLSAAAVAGSLAPLAAQARAPEAATRSFFSALSERRWLDASRLVDPETRQRFKQGELRFAEEVARGPQVPTVEELLKREPSLPRAVAEYQVQQQQQMIKQIGDPLADELVGVRSGQDIQALSDAEVVARWLEAHEVVYQARRMAAARGEPLPADALSDLQRNPVRYEVVGSVPDGEDQVQLVFRSIHPVGDLPNDIPTDAREAMIEASRQLDVLTLRRSGGGWAIVMPPQGFDFLRSEVRFGDQGQGQSAHQ